MRPDVFKKRIVHTLPRLLAMICVMALAGFAVPALAEGDMPRAADVLDIDFSISPDELVGPGDVTMTFIITNQSHFDVQNVYITSSDGLLSEPIGQIGAGETQTLVRPHAVTQEELDAGSVSYSVTHDSISSGGEKVSHMLRARVSKGSARPEVDFTRQLSSRHVAPGGQLTVTYRLTNNGNVPVTAVAVHDTLGDFTGRQEVLEVGATRTFISRVTIDNESASEASLEYTVPSGDTVSRTLAPVPVRLSESALDVSFSVGRSVFDPDRADAILTLTNTGNDDYFGLTVLDDVYGGVIADSVALPHGSNPYEVAYTYPLRGGSEFRWRVTGVSQSGEALDFVTDTVALDETDAGRTLDVRLSASTRTPRINRAGWVTFDIEMANDGTVMAQDLSLYEINRGEIRKIAVLPTGEPSRCQVGYEVREDEEFVFCLGYTDLDGTAKTASSAPIQVVISPAGIAPGVRPGESVQAKGPSVKMSTTSTFTILLAVASAALVSMFTILLVTSLRARKDRRKRIAEQRRRQRAGQDKVKAAPAAAKEDRRKRSDNASRKKK